MEAGGQAWGQGSGMTTSVALAVNYHVLVTGLLYKKWEDNWQKRCCSPSWRILPDCRHDEQAGEGEGGVEAAVGVVERSK